MSDDDEEERRAFFAQFFSVFVFFSVTHFPRLPPPQTSLLLPISRYAARYRYLSELGVSIAALQARGIVSVTVRVNTTFRTPLRLSDAFYATSAVRSVARSQLVLAEAVRRRSDDAVVALSEVTCATVDGDFKVVRIPADVRLMLEEGAARFAAAAGGS